MTDILAPLDLLPYDVGDDECHAPEDDAAFRPVPFLTESGPSGAARSQPAALLLASAESVAQAPRLPAAPLVSAEDFLLEREEEVLWWWDGIIPARGITVFAGEPLTMKTVLLMHLSAAASLAGMRVAGRMVTRTCVAYVKLEHLDRTYRDLVRRAKRAVGEREMLHWQILRSLDLDDDESVDALNRAANEVGAEMIIIDSLRRAHSGDENSSQDASELMRRLQRLTDGGRRGVVAIHHLNKATKTVRGSADITASADAEVRVSRDGDLLTLQARNHAGPDVELRLRVTFTEEGLTVESADGVADANRSDEVLRSAILRACSPGPLSRGRLRDAVRAIVGRIQSQRIDAMVDTMARQGLVRNEGSERRHAWVAMPAGGAPSTAPRMVPNPINSPGQPD